MAGDGASEPRGPRPGHGIAAGDRASALALRKRRPLRIGEPERQRLAPLVGQVVQHRNAHRLLRLARGEDERTRGGRVVPAGRGDPVGGGVVHRHRPRQLQRHPELEDCVRPSSTRASATESSPDSIRPSESHTDPVAVQSVVTGSVTAPPPNESGLTLISQRRLRSVASVASRLAPVASPFVTANARSLSVL